MAALLNTCRFTASAGGTSDFVVSSNVAGFKTPATAGAVNGRVYKWRAENAALSEWEEFEGAYTSGTTTVARTTILASPTGSKVSFTAAPQVFCVALKEDIISIEEANSFTTAQQAQARKNIGAGAPDVIIEDQKTSGTHGGTATAGTNTRTLNTLVRNVNSMASLASNQFTLGAGTYYIRWSAPALKVTNHQTYLRNVTDSTTPANGTTEYSGATTGDSVQTRSQGSAVVTIAGSKAFAIWHNVTNTVSTFGLGIAGSLSGEVYARVEITQIG